MRNAKLVILVGWAMATQLGCSAEYPEIAVGDISGRVSYGGTALATLANPVLVVGAFAYQPEFLDHIAKGDVLLPHAVFYALDPVFDTTGLPYRLASLQPFDKGYFVTAAIFNMKDTSTFPAANGIYPDLSIMNTRPDEGPVKVVAGYTVPAIDITVADLPGH
jgi:hypothetical protein